MSSIGLFRICSSVNVFCLFLYFFLSFFLFFFCLSIFISTCLFCLLTENISSTSTLIHEKIFTKKTQLFKKCWSSFCLSVCWFEMIILLFSSLKSFISIWIMHYASRWDDRSDGLNFQNFSTNPFSVPFFFPFPFTFSFTLSLLFSFRFPISFSLLFSLRF